MMTDEALVFDCETIGGLSVAWYPASAPQIDGEEAVVDAIGGLYGTGADLIAVPVVRLPDAFFDLSARLAGEILQKFQNYGLRVAIVGDIGTYLANSKALTDFARETTRRGEILFVPDRAALEARLG